METQGMETTPDIPDCSPEARAGTLCLLLLPAARQLERQDQRPARLRHHAAVQGQDAQL